MIKSIKFSNEELQKADQFLAYLQDRYAPGSPFAAVVAGNTEMNSREMLFLQDGTDKIMESLLSLCSKESYPYSSDPNYPSNFLSLKHTAILCMDELLAQVDRQKKSNFITEKLLTMNVSEMTGAQLKQVIQHAIEECK